MKMLVIEDDILYAGVLERYLEGLADELVVVRTWEDAEKYFEMANILWIDLIIPPHTAQFALLKIGEIRHKNVSSVIFVVSGAPDPMMKQKALDAGADHFAHKMDTASQNQILALMISALMKAQERGHDAIKFLQRSRQLLAERINPKPV